MFYLYSWLTLLGLSGVQARGTRINIFEQQPTHTRGAGDITNLWVGSLDQLLGGVMRNALKPSSPNKWTRYINARGQFVIPYIFGGTFDASEHATIAKAMLAISQNTCLKFQKRAGEADFVELKNERGEGCYTTVGRVPGKNVVMLETNNIATCLEFDIVVHELMHTIGLWHEQMRYDRDDYIKIHFENIAPVYYTQFEKISSADSTTYGIKYDYESVMHYAKDAFASIPGKITMETLNKDFQDVIGKVTDAAPSDYFKICNIYSCKKCMGKPWKSGKVTGESSINATSITNTTTPPYPLPKTVNSTNIEVVDQEGYGKEKEEDNTVGVEDIMPESTAILALPDLPIVNTRPRTVNTDEQDRTEVDLDGGVKKNVKKKKMRHTNAEIAVVKTPTASVQIKHTKPEDTQYSTADRPLECQEYGFCRKLITALNKPYLCARKPIKSFCCQSCFKNN